MANEHVGRRQSIGLGRETTSGTAVAASAWIPKISGSSKPVVEVAGDAGAYGVIDALKEITTVKNMTEVSFSAVARSIYTGHILHALFGNSNPCVRFPVSSISGTFTVGETITESTSSATGTLQRNDQGAGTAVLYIKPVTGTFTGGQTLTGGSSGATATGGTIESPSALRYHIFRVLNTNTHPSYTLYGSDPVSDDRAAYCMLDNVDFECVVGDFLKFTANFKGKALASTSTQTPSFSTQDAFAAKYATFKMASAFNSLDAASAVSVERVTLNFPKNLIDFTAFGSTSPASLHNQEFGQITGEITLLYNAVTQRDLVLNSTKQACRLTIANTDATTLGSGTKPTLQFDFPSVAFREFNRGDENGGIIRQTLSFTAQFDTDRSLTVEAFLVNSQVTAY